MANVKGLGCSTLEPVVLGESPGPPLHYACQGVNPTNIAMPANLLMQASGAPLA
jgi:hypothetical protein